MNTIECVTKFLWISEEEPVEDEDAELQAAQPTVKIGAKKQKKLEEKQAKKAQREVTRHSGCWTCRLKGDFIISV